MGVARLDADIEKFVRLSEEGNVFVMLPEKPNYDKLAPGAIGRIQYHDVRSNIQSNYGTLFIKSVTDCDGKVFEPEDYTFLGAKAIKLGFVEKNENSKVYGEIILGTEKVQSLDNLKLLIEFM
ncbi:MAG: hypothetical protein K0B07_01595 [DPANN group archaeon]|nr:hypothetical protein [DPANN group archaeon]